MRTLAQELEHCRLAVNCSTVKLEDRVELVRAQRELAFKEGVAAGREQARLEMIEYALSLGDSPPVQATAESAARYPITKAEKKWGMR